MSATQSTFRSFAALAAVLLISPAQGQNLPLPPIEARTPTTRALSADEARAALERDWLFQAMGEPLADRAAKEIGWARDLAARLRESPEPTNVQAESARLDELEKRLDSLRRQPATSPQSTNPHPAWIWFPEGQPATDAPTESRYFRRAIELTSDVRRAELRITADDACEVFVNGHRVGAPAGWNRARAFDIAAHLVRGANVLAVRAENRPAPVDANPAGLIARCSVTLANDATVSIVSDASWRAQRLAQPRWETLDFDDASWPAATVAAPWGGGPWGRRVAGLERSPVSDDPVAFYARESAAMRDCYVAIRRVKRRILLANPVLDFAQLLFIDQPRPRGPESIHEAIHRMGIMATPGGRLLVLDGLDPAGAVRQLAPQEAQGPGSFWKADLSFDATRVLFCFKPHRESSFHLYEMRLDGGDVRQLTNSEYDDIDPIYLPDGHLLFTTTRGNSYVRCGPFIYSYVLARCNADGSDVYLISYNNEPDFVPTLMEDGRVIYSRWEYTDKALWRVQSLWSVNPDGTDVRVVWGNQSVWPDHVSQPRQIPGSPRVMFCGVGHHDWWSGSIGIIDPRKGSNFPHGLTKVTRDQPWPECGNGPVDPGESDAYHAAGKFTGYSTPYPLSERDFLVSARGVGERFRLYLMDVDGNRELVYEGEHDVLHAIPIRPRKRPPARPDRVAWPGVGAERGPQEPGILFSADVYEGVPEIPRGKARYLRVFQQDYKTYSTWHKTYRHSGPAVSIIQEEAVKRILGVTPIEADGSVNFKVPSGQTLFFQLLDENYRCLQTMRSFTGVMPGEVRGCVGCHESRDVAASYGTDLPLALRKPPRDLTPPPWGDESIGYERFVQPVLDEYCGECHQGDGEARKELDLTLRPGHGPFKEPYLTLVGDAGWGNPVPRGPGYGIAAAIPVERMGMNEPRSLATIPPMRYLSYRSRLIDIASSGEHYDVRLDPVSLRRLIAWVDASCPYRGEEEIRALADPDFPGIETLPIRPRVKTAPVVARP